ncbi:hypothetical protein RJ639_008013 [Escallonia herrerae]|uniref:Pentatricopeptide repeat-containing protein n=1 Tax=Escallonia herrerae TaxID=1293975 RepID=A0AA88VSN9_9ASTE|nr:hypothetical protein RJ639_008013 [Escallonia herrerae]
MSIATTTEVPYHLTPEVPSTENSPTSKLSQKTILNLLNTKCSTSLQHLKQAHALIVKTDHFQDHFVAGTLVKSYANRYFGTLSCSVKAFHQVSNPNVFVWNSIMKGCLDNNEPCMSISFYCDMVVSNSRPNKYTYPTLLKASTIAKAVQEGLQIHAHVVKHGFNGDGYVKSAGIQMYAYFGYLKEAKNILDYNGVSDVICCNAMIDGYLNCGDVEGAKMVFENITKKNVGSWNAMISGFARCGKIEAARAYFNEMPEKDDISWSAMVDGYNTGGYYKEALEIVHEMQRKNVRPGKFILSIVMAPDPKASRTTPC